MPAIVDQKVNGLIHGDETLNDVEAKMTAVVFHGKGDLRVEKLPVPKVEKGRVKVIIVDVTM